MKVTDEGLQDNGPYGSVSHRFIGAGMDFMVSPSQRFVFEGSLGISSGSQILTSATPRIVSGFDFDPELSLKVLLGNITLAMNAGYSYSYFDGAEGLNAAAASLRFSMESPKGFDGAAWFGIDWASIPIIRYPFGLSFEGPLGQSSSFRLEGGYLTRRHPSFVLWEEYPLLDTSEPLVFDSGWYGDGDFRFIIARSLILSAGARFERLDRSIVRSDSVDPATGLFPAAIRAESIRFTPRGQLTWRLSESFTVTGALSTEILDSSGFDPSLSAEIDAAFTHSSDRFGASAYMLFDVFGEFLWPDAGLSAFYRITDGVDLELRARDLFAIGPARGRTIWGEYETPGFRVLLMTRISL